MIGRILPRSFYSRETVLVARELLGKLLIRRYEGRLLVGRIVEVEAYRGGDDPASHAYRGPTRRNRVMFGPPGHSYIYFTYGNHHCLNVVAHEKPPGAILIRALEPLMGTEVMKRLRRVREVRLLTNGPGRLTEALALTLEQNGVDLTHEGSELFLCEGKGGGSIEVGTSPRIGIREGVDKPWRFFVKGSPFLSRP